ncbi:MAG: cytochrome-c peroxidase [Bacteroidota bacterium]
MKLSAKRLLPVVLGVVSLAAGLVWLARTHDSPAPSVVPAAALAPAATLDTIQPIQPLPPLPALSPLRVALGERLFRDKRFSADHTLACVSCHDFAHGGADGRRVSIGIGGAPGGINAPTVFNSGLNFVQFWDGRAASLEEQAAGPIHNPAELGSSWEQVLGRLSQDAGLVAEFRRAYRDGLTAANVADAIATFERSLLTPNSRFDRYLQGDKQALTALEVEGYRRFSELGCTSCHQGALLGGNMYQKFGVLGDYFAGYPETKADLGRYNVTGREADKHVFKVPTLRNIALTAPYFHNGSVDTLAEAVLIMGRYQLGRELAPADVQAIVAFLNSLNGEWRGVALK